MTVDCSLEGPSWQPQAPACVFTLQCVWLELRSGSGGQGKDMGPWPGLLPLQWWSVQNVRGSGLSVSGKHLGPSHRLLVHSWMGPQGR